MTNAQRGYRCPIWVSDVDLAAAAAHFLACFPNEGVGVINDTGFVPLENISSEPTIAFETAEDSWVTHGPVKVVLHSHTNRAAKPSSQDMFRQSKTEVPWGIYLTDGVHIGEPIWFGDQLDIPPLVGRVFVHGVQDCYAVIRDAFRLGKDFLATCPDEGQRIYGWPYDPIVLLDPERSDRWWTDGGNIYAERFAEAGFVDLEIDRHKLTDLRVGDCFLYKLGNTKVVNHAGVYVGNNLILHHVEGYTSHRTPLHTYAYGAERWVRYNGSTAM